MVPNLPAPLPYANAAHYKPNDNVIQNYTLLGPRGGIFPVLFDTPLVV